MISLIVAVSKNGVIGNKGCIPWRIKGEQRRFRELTTGNAVIMGRKSYEEIGHPLPNRLNIIVSSTAEFEGENLLMAHSVAEAIELAGDKDVYISGGAGIYAEAMPLVERMYITEVEAEVEGDTFFPEFNAADFERVEDEHVEGDIPYTYVTYIRK